MKTHVDFDSAKLLKEKGFDTYTQAGWYILAKDHTSNYKKNLLADESKIFFAKDSYELDVATQIDEESYHEAYGVLRCPTIAEVVSWLYEKHGIWIQTVSKNSLLKMCFKYEIKRYEWDSCITDEVLYASPIEAYLKAINYSLKNLI